MDEPGSESGKRSDDRPGAARGTRAGTASYMPLPRRVLVLGFRRTGQAVAAALAARGVTVRVADARPASALGVTGAPPGVELRLGEDGPPLLSGVELVVPSPGDRKSTRLNSSHERLSRMPSS